MTGTDQQPAVLDEEAFAVRRTVRIAASPERVWQALTQEEHIARWFGQRASLPDVRVGARGTVGWDGTADFPVRVDACEAPRVFAFTWGTPGEPLRDDNATQARFTLEPDGDGTVLTVVETGFETLRDPAAAMRDNRQGWTSEIDELIAYVEQGAAR